MSFIDMIIKQYYIILYSKITCIKHTEYFVIKLWNKVNCFKNGKKSKLDNVFFHQRKKHVFKNDWIILGFIVSHCTVKIIEIVMHCIQQYVLKDGFRGEFYETF